MKTEDNIVVCFLVIPLMLFVTLVGCGKDETRQKRQNRFKPGDWICSKLSTDKPMIVTEVYYNGNCQARTQNGDLSVYAEEEIEHYDADLKDSIVLDEPKLNLDKMSVGEETPKESPQIAIESGPERSIHLKFNKFQFNVTVVTNTGSDETLVILKEKKE